jgi:hypothetical protein
MASGVQPSARVALLLAALSTGFGPSAMAQDPDSRPTYTSSRFDEDWTVMRDPARRTGVLDRFKWVPLNHEGTWYATFGGELRAGYEYLWNPVFGLESPPRDGYFLSRAFLFADLHLGPNFRSFIELASGSAPGWAGTPPPTQEDDLDLLQGFGELTLPLDGAQVVLRAGRQEMSFGSSRLVSVREGSNIRRSFDGARVSWVGSQDFRVDAFAVQPVAPRSGTFDDRRDRNQDFGGVYATTAIPAVPGLKADFYYLGLDRKNARFAQGTATERRHTIGARLFGHQAGFDWNVEAAFQFGSFGRSDIRAWTISSDTGYTFGNVSLSPRLGLKADVISGDKNLRDGTLSTFNPLFPKLPYFSDANVAAPANLIDIQPSIALSLTRTLSLTLGWNPLWKQSKADAFYAPPLSPVAGTSGTRGRFIGHQWIATIGWSPAPRLALSAAYVHFVPGEALKEAGGRSGDFVGAYVQYRF